MYHLLYLMIHPATGSVWDWEANEASVGGRTASTHETLSEASAEMRRRQSGVRGWLWRWRYGPGRFVVTDDTGIVHLVGDMDEFAMAYAHGSIQGCDEAA